METRYREIFAQEDNEERKKYQRESVQIKITNNKWSFIQIDFFRAQDILNLLIL